ncbi:MAG: tyrosine-type recombinase/integrase [Candidatus Aminicenantes bacterium]|nr:tyrosine-type recombinase/integrase [Candidatus Aminicenantes bacterium]
MIDRKAQGVSEGTIHFYEVKFKSLIRYCENEHIKYVEQITPTSIREYILWLEVSGHNPGGRHAHYRAIRAFLYWYEDEVEPEGWKNPIKKVKAPIKPDLPLEPVSIESINKLVATCSGDSFTDFRDKAIFLSLLDTGTRAGEFLSINLEDLNQIIGDILIRAGKGGKPRTVFIGKQTRNSIRKYLKNRTNNSPALWITNPTHGSDRLTYWGLRSMIIRRSKSAGIQAPSLHDFRRAFALAMLREGVDVYTLAKLMGHSTIDVLKYYLKQTTEDMAIAHSQHGPVDNLGI